MSNTTPKLNGFSSLSRLGLSFGKLSHVLLLASQATDQFSYAGRYTGTVGHAPRRRRKHLQGSGTSVTGIVSREEREYRTRIKKLANESRKRNRI